MLIIEHLMTVIETHIGHMKRSIRAVDFEKKAINDQFYLRMIPCICNEQLCTRIYFLKFKNVK